jgi:aspartate aminotransferase
VTVLPYYDQNLRTVDFKAFCDTIDGLPSGSVIVLQNAAQNPTGCDPTLEEWQELAKAFKRRHHLAFFDAAYPGFATGDVDRDMESVRIFAEMEIPLILATTYGKSFGLYCERVGALFVVAPNQEMSKRIETQMRLLARAETGAQPDFGSSIVETILCDKDLKQTWLSDVRGMSQELQQRREELTARLEKLGTPGDWKHIKYQRGMFS